MPAFCGSHSYIFVKYVITKWEDCVVQKWPFCKPTMHNPLNHACFSRRSLWNSKRRIRLFWSFLKIFQKVRLILAEVISTAWFRLLNFDFHFKSLILTAWVRQRSPWDWDQVTSRKLIDTPLFVKISVRPWLLGRIASDAPVYIQFIWHSKAPFCSLSTTSTGCSPSCSHRKILNTILFITGCD